MKLLLFCLFLFYFFHHIENFASTIKSTILTDHVGLLWIFTVGAESKYFTLQGVM
jgi:hypothetical protein